MELFGTMICFSQTVLLRVSGEDRTGRGREGIPKVEEAGGHEVVVVVFLFRRGPGVGLDGALCEDGRL